MKFEITRASEARKLVDERKAGATDPRIEKIMESINTGITRRARLGETNYLTSTCYEMDEVGLPFFGRDRREAVFRPIVDALREAGYTVEEVATYSGNRYQHIDISW